MSAAVTPLEELPRRVGRIDLVFEATGAAAVVLAAMRMLGPDGVCILSSVTGGTKTVEVDVAQPGTARWCSATAWSSGP